MKTLKDSQLLVLAAVLFVSFLLLRGTEDAIKQNYHDFYSYYKGGLALRTGTSLYFDPNEPSFRYSPFFALFMIPFTLLSPQAGYFLWILLMIVQALFIFGWARSLADKNRSAGSPPAVWLFGASLLLIPNFFMTNFDKGQANIFILFWMVWAWIWLERNRPIQAGLCLAVAILTKVTPLLLLPFLIWRRQLKCVVSCVVSIPLLLLLPWIIQGMPEGLATLKNWFIWTKQAHDHYFLAGHANQSLFAAVHRLFSKQESTYMMEHGFATLAVPLEMVKTVYAFLSTALYSLFLFRPSERLSKPPYFFSPAFLDFAGILIAVTLIFPVAWKYAFVNLLLPVMALMIYLYRNNGRDFGVLGLLTGFFFLSTICPSLPDSTVRIHVNFYSLPFWGTLLLAAAFLKMKHRPLLISSARISKAPSAGRSRLIVNPK